MGKKKNTLAAVIHLGSEMVSMQLIEYTDIDKIKILEQTKQKVHLGEEAFKNKKISLKYHDEVFQMEYAFLYVLIGFKT